MYLYNYFKPIIEECPLLRGLLCMYCVPISECHYGRFYCMSDVNVCIHINEGSV